jgi:hypothetical protein
VPRDLVVPYVIDIFIVADNVIDFVSHVDRDSGSLLLLDLFIDHDTVVEETG